MRVYVVADNPPAPVSVVAAAQIELSAPSRDGLFPVDRDIPVDHAWSQDGALLVVLRRSSFTVYSRRDKASSEEAKPQQRGGIEKDAVVSQDSVVPLTKSAPVQPVGPELSLDLRYLGTNSFEGKVVTCCSGATAGLKALDCHGETEQGGTSDTGKPCDRPYLIAIGGSYGVECHHIEVAIENHRASNNLGQLLHDGSPKLCGNRGRETGKEQVEDRRHNQKTASNDSCRDGNGIMGIASCQLLATLLCGYPVVSIAFSSDASLFAAAAMTGHVQVWNVSTLREWALPPPPKTPVLPRRESRRHSTGSERRRRGRGKGSREGSDTMNGQRGKRGPRERRKSHDSIDRQTIRSLPPGASHGPLPLWSATVSVLSQMKPMQSSPAEHPSYVQWDTSTCSKCAAVIMVTAFPAILIVCTGRTNSLSLISSILLTK